MKYYVLPLLALVFYSCSEGKQEPKKTSSQNEEIAGSDVPGHMPVEITPIQRQLIDIRTYPVQKRDVNATIRTVGIVAYDQTKVFNINFKISGWIEKLYVDKPGQLVSKGDPLMDLYSPELYSAQQEYLTASRYYQKLKFSSAKKEYPYAGSEENLKEARDLLDSSYKRLNLWDISDQEVASLRLSGKPSTFMQLKSPVNGYVVEKNIYPGAMIKPGEALYHMADLSTVWINADFYEYELPLIKLGQKVAITLTAFPNKTLEAIVDFIYPYLENKTRTTLVRLVVANHDFSLKPNMYANVELKINLGEQIIIPASAVFNTGLRQYVFVEEGKGIFIPRVVELGPRAGSDFVIHKGVKVGEQVVIDGNFLINSESQLRAAGSHRHGQQ